MSGRRAAWICAELTAEVQRRLEAAGCEADREALYQAFWPLSRRLAKAQKRLLLAAWWYESALADAERSAVAAAAAVDAVAVPHEGEAAERREVAKRRRLVRFDPAEWHPVRRSGVASAGEQVSWEVA